jgi:hypothetical protein
MAEKEVEMSTDKSRSDKELQISVQTTRGTRVLPFSKEDKVSDVIEKAVTAFGFAAGDRFEVVLATNLAEPLKPERPLVSYGLKDGDVLVLTAIGGGV